MLKQTVTEQDMQSYANQKEGFEVEFLLEYAKSLGYSHELLNTDTDHEEYLFYKK